jgi:hypothetical protein
MLGLARRWGAALAVLAVLAPWAAAPAVAQEDLDRGKTPAQLYASDCAICHKSPRGLSRAGGYFGLSGFLRQHYTASRQAAVAIAAYLQKIDSEPASRRSRKPSRDTRSSRPKLPPAKPTAAKSSEKDAKPAETKPVEAEPAKTKTSETKPAGEKPPAAEHDEAKAATKDGTKPEPDKPAKNGEPAKDAAPDKKSD